jgi:O-antigen ligase
VYLARAFGWWAFVPAAIVALPVLALGGRSDEAAAQSTQQRYEAWAQGLTMWKQSPVFGVGAGQFGEHHYLTAHNSFVLTLAETGFIGLVLFTTMIYISIKSLVVGLRELKDTPGAAAAQVWGMALLGSFVGALFSISTLSFAYKSVLWIMFALVGAWTNCIRHHRPDFRVRISWLDFIIIVVACIMFVGVFLPIFLKAKGEM